MNRVFQVLEIKSRHRYKSFDIDACVVSDLVARWHSYRSGHADDDGPL